MTFPGWERPVELLTERLVGATDDQIAAAKAIGLSLRAGIPALVAAHLISARLYEPIRLREARGTSEEQIQYGLELARATKSRDVAAADLADKGSFDAWIDVLHARRAKAALERLKPCAGDVAVRSNGDLDEIASIGADGQVYFTGGLGARERVHKLKIKSRSTATSTEAKKARAAAANRAAHRRSATLEQPPSAARMKQLEAWLIDEAASSGDREVFEDVVSNAADEAVIQKYLTAHPQLFRMHLRGNLGNAVIPWPRLGAEFVPDFLLVEADSAGLHWTLVELESPTKKMLNKDGQLAPKTREAIAQIEVWREWLTDNLDYARRPRSERGLGLVDIRPDRTHGLIIVGRREANLGVSTDHRTRVARDSRILIRSYDWFVDQSGGRHLAGMRRELAHDEAQALVFG
jgi:hypothetical protein